MNRKMYIPLLFALLCALAIPTFVQAEQDDPATTGPDQAQQNRINSRLDQITNELKRMQTDMRRMDERISKLQSQPAKPPTPPKPPAPPKGPGPMMGDGMMGGGMMGGGMRGGMMGGGMMGTGQGRGTMQKQMQQQMEECRKLIEEHLKWMREGRYGDMMHTKQHAWGGEHHGEWMHGERQGYRDHHDNCDEHGGMTRRWGGEKGGAWRGRMEQSPRRFEGRTGQFREGSKQYNSRETAEQLSRTLREEADRIDQFLHEGRGTRGAEFHGMRAERYSHSDYPDEKD